MTRDHERAESAAPSLFYEDEAVRLFHGDCLAVLPTLEPVDHVITDPPYARDVYVRAAALGPTSRAAWKQKRRGDVDAPKSSDALVKMAAGDIGAIDPILAPVALHIAHLTQRWAIVFSDVETAWKWRKELTRDSPDPFVPDSMPDVGPMRYVRTGAWVKPDAMPQMSGDRPGVGFEPCTICHADGPISMRWNGGGSLAVWTHFTAKGNGRPEGHPCPKPLPLMVELVKLFTDLGETILDPFAGSGTTLVAAKLNGRKAIGIELSEAYCAIAAKRLRETEPGRLFDSIAQAKPQSLIERGSPS